MRLIWLVEYYDKLFIQCKDDKTNLSFEAEEDLEGLEVAWNPTEVANPCEVPTPTK